MKYEMVSILCIIFAAGILAEQGLDSGSSTGAQPTKSDLTLEAVVAQDNSAFTIRCEIIFPPSSPYTCLEDRTRRSITYLNPDRPITTAVRKRSNQIAASFTLVIHPAKDPQVADRLYQGLEKVKGIGRRFSPQILELTMAQDFVYAIFEGSIGGSLEALDDLQNSLAINRRTNSESEHFASLMKFVTDFHKTGYVAINLPVIISLINKEKFGVVSPGLQWMVAAGEPVGACPFDPLTTEPTALSDPSFPADPALDYYSLGIHILKHNFLFKTKAHEIKWDEQAIIAMKEKGEFEFPRDMEMCMAFLAACFLQSNRTARLSREQILVVKDYIGNSPVALRLDAPVVYNVNTDPWKVREFRELIQITRYVPQENDDAHSDLSAVKPGASAKGTPKIQKWIWMAVLAGGALVCFVGICLCCRPKPHDSSTKNKNVRELQPKDENAPSITI